MKTWVAAAVPAVAAPPARSNPIVTGLNWRPLVRTERRATACGFHKALKAHEGHKDNSSVFFVNFVGLVILVPERFCVVQRS